MPILKNPKHELFAQAVAKSESAAGAYRMYYDVTNETAETNGPALARSTQVKLRIEELRDQANEIATQKIGFEKEDLIRVAVGIVNGKPSEAGPDNPLCVMKMSVQGPYYVFPDKKGFGDLLAKLCGWNAPEKQEIEMTCPDFMDEIRAKRKAKTDSA